MKKVKYLKHPVSSEEKKSWVSQGFKIVDIKFCPEGYEEEPIKKKRKRRTKEEIEAEKEVADIEQEE